jgi:hypothetical protein
MKNGKALHKFIGCGVVLLAVFVFAGTGYSRSSCNTCRTCEQSRYTPPPAPKVYAELQYRDGYPGPRLYKRQQVKKLQCMLAVMGYCSGPIDGWYGDSTARGVMLFLADTFQDIGYGKSLTEDQWDYLVKWVGPRCTQFDRQEDDYRYRYNRYQEQEYQGRQYQERQYQGRQYQEQQYQAQPFYQD